MIAVEKLKEYETVLMNKIRRMKDGKPKWRAAAELEELRDAIRVLHEHYEPKPEIGY